mmetsp:Transcript_104191/g.222669  ORF Transcript_104191/g.222669 Transcript_104191/m.222669 type:complete len:234 (+) Transcript_104191:58-759(+)
MPRHDRSSPHQNVGARHLAPVGKHHLHHRPPRWGGRQHLEARAVLLQIDGVLALRANCRPGDGRIPSVGTASLDHLFPLRLCYPMPALVPYLSALVMLEHLLSIAAICISLHEHLIQFARRLARDSGCVDLRIDLHASIVDGAQLARHLTEADHTGGRAYEALPAAACGDHANLLERGVTLEAGQRVPVPSNPLIVGHGDHHQVDATRIERLGRDSSHLVLGVADAHQLCRLR